MEVVAGDRDTSGLCVLDWERQGISRQWRTDMTQATPS